MSLNALCVFVDFHCHRRGQGSAIFERFEDFGMYLRVNGANISKL